MLSTLTLNKANITDFALERNKLLNNAKSDWSLFVDTDEKVSKELKSEISEVIKSTKYSGFYIKRKIYFCGVFVGEDKMLRLAKKGSGRWKRKVHEIWKVKGKIGILKNYIIHNTATNLTDYLDKINYHSTLHASENLREGKKSTILKIIFYSIGNFVVSLFKSRNIVFSIMKSLHSFLSWTKLYFLQH